MNSLPIKPDEFASEQSKGTVSLFASETTFIAGTAETPAVHPLALEAEMNRRAEVITDVLARIMEQPAPAAYRHWGLNE
jgi:hypothetical protein